MNTSHFKALLTFAHDNQDDGRSPVASGYRAAIKFPFSSEPLTAIFDFVDSELVFPGDNAIADITLPEPEIALGKLYDGMDFDFFENENLVGQGVVTKVY